MKVFLTPDTDSRAIKRVEHALRKHAPSHIEIVEDIRECDLAILHVWGRHETTKNTIAMLKTHGKRYAMIQYCVRSTMRPNVKDWIEMWRGAEVVWSYYDLPVLGYEDDVFDSFPFHYSPLGIDPVFKENKDFERNIIVASCSKSYLTEGVKELAQASQRVNKVMFHLGEEINKPNVICKTDIPDFELADYYSRCEFVSGLRRVEGFELPVIEGLMCGARPIVFDRPHYRKWFQEFAVFIPEVSRQETVERLVAVFKEGAKPVTKEEKALAIKRFNWHTIIEGFFNRI